MGLMRAAARTAVVAGTASAVSGRVNHRQQQKYAAQAAPQYQQAPPPAPAPAPAAAPAADEPDPVAEIERLGQLHAKGLLTDDEFTAAKKKALGL